ncbi:MAG TPA: universal stress protein [Armatimonadota bacterium]|jgi:two-component system sensor histidine kinase KdpD
MRPIERPDPDELLKRVMEDERRAVRGRLKVFLGYASRVGKTYRMLEEGVRRASRGQDVVVGYVHPDMDAATRELLGRLEAVPPREVASAGKPSLELDLNTVLQRRPQVCLIDELAHTNPPCFRHATRWEEVEELLCIGTTVVTTVNVQHLEGLQERVVQVTGVCPTETVPDSVVKGADEVVLVDITAEDLRERLTSEAQGEPHGRARLDEAASAALREMALLYAAESIDDRLTEYRHLHQGETQWRTTERLLVCLTSGSDAAELVRWGRRAATRLHAEWHVVEVVTPGSAADAGPLALVKPEVLQGSQVARITAEKLGPAILAYARQHGISQIFLGHGRWRWLEVLLGQNLAMQVLRDSAGMDVHLVASREQGGPGPQTAASPLSRSSSACSQTPHPLRPGHAHLKVYLGYAAGVGKTYQMLRDGQELRSHGHDVVLGYFEPHGRADTVSLAQGLELVPRRRIEYREAAFEEMDPEACLARRPELCLVDELAHTNVPGSERQKRWQDVVYLLNHGVPCNTTLSVQHLESLNDQVAQATGVSVRETVPDWLLHQAEEVVVVDVTPRALQNRLRRGAVYPAEKVQQALTSFFQEHHLDALREMAFRQAADEVGECLSAKARSTVDSAEHILCAITAKPSASTLVRRAARMADRLSAACTVLHVRDPHAPLPPEQASVLRSHLELAARLDLRVVEVKGDRPDVALLRYARTHEVTQVFLGRIHASPLQWALGTSTVARVLRSAADLHIHVVDNG